MNKNKKIKQKNACPLASLKLRRSGPKRRGSALIFATIILFSLLAITVTLSAITVSDMKMSQKTKSSTGAFFNADSGVEWALYKITNSDSSVKINNLPGVTFNTDGSAQCPFGGCNVFFLKSDGTVITQEQAGSLYVSDIKAVRSVGTQGAETQRAIEAAVAATDLPTGAVMFFNLATCPSGWTEFVAGRGRYIVGTPSGGANAATVGTALSNTENRPTGQHTHSYETPQRYDDIEGGNANTARIRITGTTGGVTGGAVAGTNAPYIQLLACQKS